MRPDRFRWTWRRALVELVCTLALAWYIRHHPTSAPLGAFWGAFFAVLSGIWDAFKTAATVTATAIASAFSWLKSRVFDLGRTIGGGLSFLGGKVLDVAGFLGGGLETIGRVVFNTIASGVKIAFTVLQQGVSAVVNVVKGIRDAVTTFYGNYVQPIIDALDRTKQIATILGDLGLTTFKQLAAKISGIEQKIQEPFQIVIGKLNEVLGVLNRVVTLDGLLQRLTLFKSLLSYRVDFANFTFNAFVKTDTGLDASTNTTVIREQKVKQARDDLSRLASDGVAAATPEQNQWADDLLQQIGAAL